MTLGERQRTFTRNIGKLIEFAYEQGFELTIGEAFRTEAQQAAHVAAGRSKTLASRHLQRLAIDLNLFRAGVFLTGSNDHRQLGEFWESLHPDNVWGGRWTSIPDGNHYEMKPN